MEHIELSEEHTKTRLIAMVLFLLIGAGALVYAFVTLVGPEGGWQTIQASASAGATCADEFVFLYELGAGEQPIQAESRAVTALYTQAARRAYELFSSYEGFEGTVNVYAINRRPNEELEVDAALYEAFALIQAHGDRKLYLGPVYARYDDLFSCEDDAQLVDFDPRLSESVRREYAELAAFAADPASVDLELLGENRVRLRVSQEYLDYAQREGVEDFIDFFWMKNAFIADYLAQTMIDGGYTHGTISSFDGFLRNLDGRGTEYALNIYDLVDGGVCPAGVMKYAGAMSIVCLRDYPINDMDRQYRYVLRGGEVRTAYLDVRDGLCRSALSGLTAYSRERGCAEVLLQVSPIYIAEELDRQALSALARQGVHSIYCEGRTIRGSDPELVLTELYDDGGVRYAAAVG